MTILPHYLQNISQVIYDASVLDLPLTKRVKKKLWHLPWKKANNIDFNEVNQEKILYLKEYKGRFLRPCPATKSYHCCDYQIIHIGENCPLACSYCILQAYFKDKMLKVWANQEDLFSELTTAFQNKNMRFRLGTGEFTDSLVLEPITGFSSDLINFMNNFPNTRLELKSKIVDLSWMKFVKNPANILPAWSVNAPSINKFEELGGCSSLEERLIAAKTCVQNGFRCCLHFDPIIYFENWEQEYKAIIEMIFDYITPEDIAYMSLGSFRFLPTLKQKIESNFPNSTYIYNEFITGIDGKQRLLRPLRQNQFIYIVKLLRQKGMDKQLYFCMESEEIWQQVLGYSPKSLGGLGNHLMQCAFDK